MKKVMMKLRSGTGIPHFHKVLTLSQRSTPGPCFKKMFSFKFIVTFSLNKLCILWTLITNHITPKEQLCNIHFCTIPRHINLGVCSDSTGGAGAADCYNVSVEFYYKQPIFCRLLGKQGG